MMLTAIPAIAPVHWLEAFSNTVRLMALRVLQAGSWEEIRVFVKHIGAYQRF